MELTRLSAAVIDGKENGRVLGDDSQRRDHVELQWTE